MRLASALVLLTASAASAQVVALAYGFQDSDKYTFNAGSCNSKVQVNWTATTTTLFCSELKLWATSGECGDNPVAGDLSFNAVSQTDVLALRKGSFEVTLSALPGLKASVDGGTVCGSDAVEVPHKLCGAIQTNSSTVGGTSCTVSRSSALSLVYDSKPPAAPDLSKVTELDSALKVELTATADTALVHVDVRAFGQADFTEKARVNPASASSVTVENLTNGTTYDLRARAEDGAGNVSAPSELLSGTPRRTIGFFARYREAGGGERGCAIAGGVPLLIAAGFWILRRRKRG